jgi:uncharacterized membrane protein YkvA (DUF1232 family)
LMPARRYGPSSERDGPSSLSRISASRVFAGPDSSESRPAGLTVPVCASFHLRLTNAMADRLKVWAGMIKRDVHALYLASRDPRVPWHAKALAVVVAGYALSPIDLIPDFIPVLGYLDDVILVPLGILIVVRLIPPEIMAEHREIAAAAQERPVSRRAAVAIICIGIATIALCAWLVYRYLIA